MVKYCIKCEEQINEEEKYIMIITKRGNRILEFECFHFECWKNFFEESVKVRIKQLS